MFIWYNIYVSNKETLKFGATEARQKARVKQKEMVKMNNKLEVLLNEVIEVEDKKARELIVESLRDELSQLGKRGKRSKIVRPLAKYLPQVNEAYIEKAKESATKTAIKYKLLFEKEDNYHNKDGIAYYQNGKSFYVSLYQDDVYKYYANVVITKTGALKVDTVQLFEKTEETVITEVNGEKTETTNVAYTVYYTSVKGFKEISNLKASILQFVEANGLDNIQEVATNEQLAE